MNTVHWEYLIAGVIITLQSWILVEIVRLKIDTANHKVQLDRFVSDIESEKGTRARIHSDFESRLRVLEHKTSH